MHRLLIAIFLYIACATTPVVAQSDLLEANEAFRLAAQRNEQGQIELTWDIADGYYLYRDHLSASDKANDAIVPLNTPAGIQKDDPNFGLSEIYYRTVTAKLDPGTAGQIAIIYQGCKENSICYPPITQVLDSRTLALHEESNLFGTDETESAAAQPDESTGFSIAEDGSGGMITSLLERGGAVWVIGGFLLFGLLLAFTPCVLPMYPILGATLAREGERLTPLRGFILSSSYVGAMAIAFGFMGLAAAWSGQNLQVVLQSPYAVGVVAVIFTLLAASMFGLFELQLPDRWVRGITGAAKGRRGSTVSAAILGFTSALIVGPCVTAPLAAALLYIAQTGDAALGTGALFALGLGQGIPLIVFGTFGGRALPKAGRWMLQIKYAFGFVFLGAAIWMASRILPPAFTLVLWAGLLLSAGVFLGAFDSTASGTAPGRRFGKSIGLAFCLGGAILAVGAASGGTDPLRPLEHFSRPTNSLSTEAIPFVSATSVDDARAYLDTAVSTQKPTLIYFTADWCVTCGAIERDILPAPEVYAALNGMQRIKVDLSTLSDSNQALMRDLAVVGPPTMIFFDANAKEVAGSRLVGDVSIDKLLTSANEAHR